MIAPRRRTAPLFLRIFLVMIAAVAGVQLVTTALIFLLPAPVPKLFTLPQVGAALTGKADEAGELRIEVLDAQTASARGRRLGFVEQRLAEELKVPESHVRVWRPLPAPIIMDLPLLSPMRVRRLVSAGEGPNGHVIFGDFSASLWLRGHEWRTVAPLSRSINFWQQRALFWILATVLAAAPVAWWLARKLAQPIALFAQAAERLGRDPRAEPMPLTGPPEIVEAAASFNEMQARLARYVDDRSLLMAAIAHDLRTPLMRLSLRLDAMPEPQRTAAEGDILDMKEMITVVLGFLRDLAQPAKRQKLDLRALTESVVDGFVDHGAIASLAPGEPIAIEGDPAALKALLSNIIDNAISYGGAAQVTLHRQDGEIVIDVEDEGPGIPEDRLNKVFEPFFRLEGSRNRETGGMGLGLASARAVARAHGGDVKLVNRVPSGLCATVTLPA
ncbi:ATP-binding protein [Sphingobium nicotianae]|uniref:histidine kinase n=1 Tax=Sphingobium nicotianae TaxID=2782607 RepID=A0A9X1IRG1_9SPHN|nr:ATP-binding protein [Sphingobium nicotianae]MBT2187289.1 HAMP domain-containing protein [Sphingobium nicotianae]